jgi:hypothetical protein
MRAGIGEHMREFRQWHSVRDGVLGFLGALCGVGVHRVVIFDDDGRTLGHGEGATEGAAREQAWRDVHRDG